MGCGIIIQMMTAVCFTLPHHSLLSTCTMSCFSISMYIINTAMPRSFVLIRWLRHLLTTPEQTSPAVLPTIQAITLHASFKQYTRMYIHQTVHRHTHKHTHTCTVVAHFSRVASGELVPQGKQYILQVGYPPCHPLNSVKTLKVDSVPDWVQHAATMGQEHCNSSMGCLALWLQGHIPPIKSVNTLKGHSI